VWMVRILYPFSGKEVTYVKATLEKLHQILEYIKTRNRSRETLKPQDRFIALDLGLVCTGKAVTDNPTFRQAVKPVYSDEIYLKLFNAGHLKPEDDAYLAALVDWKANSATPPEQVEEELDENHEDVFLASLAGTTGTEEVKQTEVQETPKNSAVPRYKPSTLKVPTIKIVQEKEETTKEEPPAKIETSVPLYGSPEWTPFILSQLIPNTETVVKKDQVCPKCMGLKRLLEKYIGPITNVQNQVLVTPNRDNYGIYVVQVTVSIRVDNPNHPAYVEGLHNKIIAWSDISQTWANSDSQAAIVTQNPVASCFTKALSRCVRSLLGLSGVYTSEEMTDEGAPLKSHDPDSRAPMDNLAGDIKPNQMRFITGICDKYGADVTKVIREVLDYGEDDCPSLTDISAQDAKAIQMFINNFQTSPCPKHLRKEK